MTVVQSHILAAAMEYLKMSSTSDKPSHSMLQDELWIEERDTKKDILDLVTKEIVQQFVDLEPLQNGCHDFCSLAIPGKRAPMVTRLLR